jgi:dUTP pyrophosphatase
LESIDKASLYVNADVAGLGSVYSISFPIPTLKVKKLAPEATLPAKAKADDAGYDLVAIDDGTLSDDGTFLQYRTGIAIELPKGYHTELFPRSSITKTDLILANSVGVVDNGYRGEVVARFKVVPRHHGFIGSGNFPIAYKKGDKIAQLVIRQTFSLEVEEVTELSSTERGTGGFGSTGK